VVEDCYQRAHELVERLGATSRSFPVLWGRWFVSYNRGQYAAAHETANRLLAFAGSSHDSQHLLEAHHALWATANSMGEPALAVRHAEQGIALYDRERHAATGLVYGGHDPGACAHYQGAMNQWLLGYPDRAQAGTRDALRLAAELAHPMTTTIALWFEVWMRFQRGERDLAAAAAEQLVAVGTARGFVTWIDCALVVRPIASQERLSRDRLADLHRQLVSRRSAAWRHVFCLCAFAELCADSGHPDEGLRIIAAVSPADRQAFCAPEVYRLEGELLLRGPQSAIDTAERCFLTALDLARARSARSLELRAALSLARLWRGQGRRDAARTMVADVYGWFTEGFETADLRAARALLDGLGPA